MIITYKFRLYPTSAQELKLLSTLNLCRNLYNGALQERQSYYKTYKKSLSYNYQQNLLPLVKDLCPEYKNIHSQILQDVLRRLDKSYKAFFRRIKSGEKPGFPRFQSYKRYNSFTFSQSGFQIEKNKLILSKIGSIKISLHREILGEIKTCTIIRSRSPSNKWYVCFSTSVEKQTQPKTGNTIGIDLGIKNYIVTSNNEVVANPKFLNKHLERLALASRRYSKKSTIAKRLHRARLYEKVTNIRNDWQHKVANQFVKNNDVIIAEDLSIDEMQTSSKFGSNMKRHIADASWGKLIQLIAYKAEYADKKLVLVDPRNTSKMCSCCGKVKEDLGLDVRIYKCEQCNNEIDRDYNAAINIKKKGIATFDVAISENRDIFSAEKQEASTLM